MRFEDLTLITIAPDRVRREFDKDYIESLADSIISKGLINPISVRRLPNDKLELVAGECRMRAVKRVYEKGGVVRCNGEAIPQGTIAYLHLDEMTEDLRLEAEIEENTCRRNLSWQETAAGVERLHKLRETQAAARGERHLPKHTAAELAKRQTGITTQMQVGTELLIAKHLDDPKVANAPTREAAVKLIKRKMENSILEALGEAVATVRSTHSIFIGDCRKVLPTLDAQQFDVILTDPPYGIDIHEAGSIIAAAHHYEDAPGYLLELLLSVPEMFTTVAKPQAHLYWFCDLQHFDTIAYHFEEAGWDVWKYPIIWHKLGRGIAPDPVRWPKRTYECILFARRGDKPVHLVGDDVIVSSVGTDLVQAEKPAKLLKDLLSRSCVPGDTVLDAFAGSGSIIEPCNELRLRATLIEKDPARGALATARVKGIQGV